MTGIPSPNRFRIFGTMALARLCLVMAMAGLAVPVRADTIEAAKLLDAPIDYAADYTLSSGRVVYHGTVVHAPGRERRDFETNMGGQAIILRRDIDQATIMWLKRKWYVTTNLSAVAQLVGGFEGVMLERRREGSEMVDGERCVRWRADSDNFHGRLWITPDGVLMKAAGKASYRGKDTDVLMELSHLRREPVDPQEFLPPPGFHGIPLNLSALGLGKKEE